MKADHQPWTDSHIPDAWKTEQHLLHSAQRGQGHYGEGSQASVSLASYVSQPSLGESIIWGTGNGVPSSYPCGGQCGAGLLPEGPRPSFGASRGLNGLMIST